MCVDTTKYAHFLIRKGICEWKPVVYGYGNFAIQIQSETFS